MAAATHLPLSSLLHSSRRRELNPRSLSFIGSSPTFLRFPRSRPQLQHPGFSSGRSRAAYVTAPASDPDSIDKGPNLELPVSPTVSTSPAAISWAVIWPLLARHKLRIVMAIISLVGCTSCTLSMPLLSGMLNT